METSRKTTFAKGVDFYGVVFALIVINFIGAILFLVPLVLTLPVTFYALAELYDEHF
jgi:multisubunit Na+/H+ antiporter MnhG subunit